MNPSPLPLPEFPAAVGGSEIILMSRAKSAVENTGFNPMKEWVHADSALRKPRDESKPPPEQKQKAKRQTDHLFFFLKI